MPHESTGCIAKAAASGENSRRFWPLPVPAVNATSSPVVFYPESLAAADAEVDLVVPGGDEPATGIPENLDKKSRTEFNKLQKRLRRLVGQAITDFNMIEEGDKVMVCLSGGKDSYTMLEILLNLQISAPVKFEVVAVNLDQKQPGFPEHVLPEYLTKRGVPFYILEKDTYSIVKELTPEGKTYCAVCSRLRRGNLYAFAQEIGATKVALGHHRDDMLETFFMNLFHGGRLATMPPKLVNEDGDLFVYRPLAFVSEADCDSFAKAMNYPIIPCDLCGSQDGLQRMQVKQMLNGWEAHTPGRSQVMFRALTQVQPSHLADPTAFDFAGLRRKTEEFEANPLQLPGED